MSLVKLIEGFFLIVPIVVLLLVGGAISLQSGVHHLTTGRDYLKLAGNFSQMVLRILAYVAILLAVQHLIGLRPNLGW
jgi:hypothetical protein